MFIRYDTASYRRTRTVYRLPATTHQRMPLGQRLVLCTQAISAGAGQPIQLFPVRRAQLETVWHQGQTILVVRTAACLIIKEATVDFGVKNLTAILILQFMQAALGATVTQRLPLGFTQLSERFIVPPVRHCPSPSLTAQPPWAASVGKNLDPVCWRALPLHLPWPAYARV